ncbi:MAG: hypothetical protein HRU02_05845 [Myxococcales bacterium]|nr:hypothetical protein [Myxococcales bacterium]
MAFTGALFCPRCRCEYLRNVLECADCGVELVPEYSLEALGREEMPPIAELTCIRSASVGWAQALSQRLSEAGISHRIEAVPDEARGESVRGEPDALLPYGVWVREADLPAAREVDENFLRSQIPDLPEDLSAHEPAGDEQCPACGTAVSPNAQECSDCGLVLVIGED